VRSATSFDLLVLQVPSSRGATRVTGGEWLEVPAGVDLERQDRGLGELRAAA
jgi:hypothetical protein